MQDHHSVQNTTTPATNCQPGHHSEPGGQRQPICGDDRSACNSREATIRENPELHQLLPTAERGDHDKVNLVSDAEFALALLDMLNTVILANADRFHVHDRCDECGGLLEDGEAVNDTEIQQPTAVSHPVRYHDGPVCEIEWRPEYGDRLDFYSIRELAFLTQRAPSTVRKWASEGKIASIRLGGEWPAGQVFVPKNQLQRLRQAGLGEFC